MEYLPNVGHFQNQSPYSNKHASKTFGFRLESRSLKQIRMYYVYACKHLFFPIICTDIVVTIHINSHSNILQLLLLNLNKWVCLFIFYSQKQIVILVWFLLVCWFLLSVGTFLCFTIKYRVKFRDRAKYSLV